MNWESWIAWIIIALCFLAIPFAVMIVGWRIHGCQKRWEKDSDWRCLQEVIFEPDDVELSSLRFISR